VETVLERPRESATERAKSFSSFAIGLTSIYFLLELINILRHGMWRDEIQTWSLALRSHTLGQFLSLKRYADLGHPDAWHVLVYGVSRLTANPVAMQLLHLSIATTTVYVVARFSPFPRAQKILIVFSYFLFYEYAAISRNYAIGILGIFLFCAAFRPGAKKNYLLLGILLALMAQSNIQALMLGLAFGLAILFEGTRAGHRREFYFASPAKMAFAALFFVCAVLVSVVRMQPPADAEFYPGWHLGLDPASIGRTLAMMWKAFVPIPALSRQFWNTNIVPSPPLVAVLSIIVLAVSLLFFVKKPVALVAYASGLGAMMLFRHVKYAGYLRHDGHAFILFLACLWLASYYPCEKFPVRSVDLAAEWFEPRQRGMLFAILGAQVLAAAIASSIAFEVPFSQARNTAEFLRAQHLEKMFIVGDTDAPLATVAGYLNRDIYYPRGNRMGTYVVWDSKRVNGTKEPVIDIGRDKAAELHEDVLVILNSPAALADLNRAGARAARAPDVEEIAAFPGSVVHSEDYYVYRVMYNAGVKENR
jgi:hypothetical protein